MNNKKLLLALVILITFIGGILIGTYFSSNHSYTLKIKQTPKSGLKPEEKKMPRVDQMHSKVLEAYVQDFRDPKQLDYSKLTHVIFSFVHPTKDGGILYNGETALKNLRTTVSLAKKNHIKVMVAIGGWFHINGGESYPYFKAAISNPAARTRLVHELASFADREHLDGIDIDFEHPHSSEDAENLAAFAKELGDVLHSQKKELSVAVYSKIQAVTLTETGFVKYDPSMFQAVDHVNIMAYDGQWDDGYHPENLSPYPFAEKIVSYWADYFDQHNFPKEKLVLGVPLYAQPANPKIKQVSYAAIIKQHPENAATDTINMNGTTYYYNGELTMEKKTNLALDHGFGGMMMWEAGHDAQGPMSITSTIYKTIADSSKEPVKYYTVKRN